MDLSEIAIKTKKLSPNKKLENENVVNILRTIKKESIQKLETRGQHSVLKLFMINDFKKIGG